MANPGEQRGLSRKMLMIIIGVFVIALLAFMISSLVTRGPATTLDDPPQAAAPPA